MLSDLKSKSYSSLSTWFIDLVGIIIVLGIFYAIWIGSYPLFTPDEGRYSEIAREMIVTGDFITPRLNGVVFLDKPILYYWLQASAIKIFGLKEAALRLWPATMGILACLFVYATGRQLFNRRTGLLAAVALATSPLYYGAAHYANLDLEVAVFVSISLLSFLMSIQSSATLRKILLITAYVFAGLATLTKGLIGFVLPGLIIGTWILLLNRWKIVKTLHLPLGILIFASITIPWYVLVQLANPQFFHFFFVTQQFSRFLTIGTFNNQTTIWFYLPIIAAGFFPWTVFLIQALYQNLTKVIKNRHIYSTELFLLLWIVIIFIFFSIPRSKTVGYILPVAPGLALLIAHYLDQQWNAFKSLSIKLGILSYSVMTIGIFILCLWAPHIKFLEVDKNLIPYLNFTGTLFLISGTVLFFLRNSLNKSIYVLLATATIFSLTISASSTVLNQKTVKPLALYLKNVIQPNDNIVTYYKYYQDLPIYLERRISIVADWNASDIPQYDNWVRELWFGLPFQDTSSWLLYPSDFWKRWHSQERLFVLLNKNYFSDFKKNTHSKIYQLNEFNDVLLVSNYPYRKIQNLPNINVTTGKITSVINKASM